MWMSGDAMYRIGRTSAALALAVAASGAPSPAGAQDVPPLATSVVVTPAAALRDGQVVTVEGTGPAAVGVTVVQCQAGANLILGCDMVSRRRVPTDADGRFSTSLPVQMLLRTVGGDVVDCRTGAGCVIAALPYEWDLAGAGTASMAFAPGAQPLPRPTLTMDPPGDLVHGQLVTLTGSGFAAGEQVNVWQCTAVVLNGLNDCLHLAGVTATAEGTVTAVVDVSAILRVSGAFQCSGSTPPCELVVDAESPMSPWAGRVQLIFDPEPPPLPPPVMVVEPADEITDPSSVAVTGSGFTNRAPVAVLFCAYGVPESWTCSEETRVDTTADPAGRFSVTLDVASAFGTGGTADSLVDCRRAPGCVVVAADGTYNRTASAPLTFGPLAPGRGRYLDPVFPEVDITHDVVYHRAIGHDGVPVDLQMDIYQPAGDTATRRPVVMNMHGWMFLFGDEDDMAYLSFEYARRGYVSVSISYRLRPDHEPGDPQAFARAVVDAYDDAAVAVQWIHDHAAEYRIDPDSIAAAGLSSGGAVAFALAYPPGEHGSDTPAVAAALPTSGTSVFTPQTGAPPVLAQHGAYDSILPIDDVRTTCAQARAIGNVCELTEYSDQDHLFSQRRALVRRNADFLAEHMLAPRGYLAPPVAAAGADVTVTEGGSAMLDGSASTEPDGSDLTYAWTPAEHLDDPSSPTPAYTGADDGSEALTLTVTDSHGMAATDQVVVTTENAPPALTILPVTVAGSSTLDLASEVTDPGTLDTHVVAVDWGDGIVEPAVTEPTHAYAEPGRYRVIVTATDDDGATAIWGRQLVVGCTRAGSDRNDVVLGLRGGDVICGLGGDDILLDLFGGDDALYGGPGDDLLYGGPGDDDLVGGVGRDLAWAGPGRDTCTAEQMNSC